MSSVTPVATVLVPTDFSRGAGHALARAMYIPLQRGAAVHLLHVLTPLQYQEPLRMAQAETAIKSEAARARALAKKNGIRVSVVSKVVVGRPLEEIVRQSRLLGAELIVLGRHSRRPVRDLFVGSTADRVIRYGDLPVLVVNGPARRAYARPIASVDFGETTRTTLETLLRVVGPAVTEVVLAHSYRVPFEAFAHPSYPSSRDYRPRRDGRRQAATNAAEVLAALPRWGVSWRTDLAYGDARTAALTAARASKADLMALGTHARSGLSHYLVGSVAEWLLATAPCDVLIARPTRFTFQPL